MVRYPLIILLTSALTTFGITTTLAQTPIRELQRSPGITISGVITSVVGNDFVLDDGTGEIIVDAGPRWYHQLNLQEGEQVTVLGEYGNDEFDAFRITRSSGEVIQIREASGPPPWAGGPNQRPASRQ